MVTHAKNVLHIFGTWISPLGRGLEAKTPHVIIKNHLSCMGISP